MRNSKNPRKGISLCKEHSVFTETSFHAEQNFSKEKYECTNAKQHWSFDAIQISQLPPQDCQLLLRPINPIQVKFNYPTCNMINQKIKSDQLDYKISQLRQELAHVKAHKQQIGPQQKPNPVQHQTVAYYQRKMQPKQQLTPQMFYPLQQKNWQCRDRPTLVSNIQKNNNRHSKSKQNIKPLAQSRHKSTVGSQIDKIGQKCLIEVQMGQTNFINANRSTLQHIGVNTQQCKHKNNDSLRTKQQIDIKIDSKQNGKDSIDVDHIKKLEASLLDIIRVCDQ